ncbi:unnamed protein product [Lactuca saligna]|uniref:Uncharacterized protein n=1 Tax=Lactuca saligna TaxID=75948 RepID=A0AA35ZK74_LACSI|nr:unnamed protein product [Lactuca saligna]
MRVFLNPPPDKASAYYRVSALFLELLKLKINHRKLHRGIKTSILHLKRSDGGNYSNSNSNLVDSESGDDSNESERCSSKNDLTASSSEQSITQILKRIILPWKKRKLNFKSPPMGEPLLKKDYGEEGGDDIDFDRRQLSSNESLVNLPSGNSSGF